MESIMRASIGSVNDDKMIQDSNDEHKTDNENISETKSNGASEKSN